MTFALLPLAIFSSAILPSAVARPTEGGAYRYESTDVVTSLDGENGLARVWYSTSGPNAVKEGDDDGDGLPDFAQKVGIYAEDVLATYEDFGFRPVVSDGAAGGSDAMDVYLVDFGGDADGNYAAEQCTGEVCSGYFQMENDFSGYGYSDVDTAIQTLTSHELFHAEQAAYNVSAGGDNGSWYAEGTAVWAENFYSPDSEDFQYFCDDYLTDTGRSLDQPPAGPIPSFSYSTALWWYFVTERYGDAWMIDYLEATADDEDLVQAIADRVDLPVDFVDFARWNLATGSLAGGLPDGEGYGFASAIGPPSFEDRGDALDDDQRFYPLSTTYYKLEWPGGDLQFGLAADAPDVRFQLWAVDDSGRVSSLVTEPASTAGIVDIGAIEAGDYYLLCVNPTLADESTKVEFCLGADATHCQPAVDTADTGVDAHGGCGCSASAGRRAGGVGNSDGSGSVGAAFVFASALSVSRRRRADRRFPL